jgi:hypothetical protein
MSFDLENAKFIARHFMPGNVRDAMTDMVAEIERLRGELAIWNQPGAMVRRVNHLRALNAELIEALKDALTGLENACACHEASGCKDAARRAKARAILAKAQIPTESAS